MTSPRLLVEDGQQTPTPNSFLAVRTVAQFNEVFLFSLFLVPERSGAISRDCRRRRRDRCLVAIVLTEVDRR